MPRKKKTPDTPQMRGPDDSFEMNDISSPSGVGGNDISVSTGSEPGEPADVAVYVRVARWKRDEWNEVAVKRGVSVSEFVRSCVDPVVDDVLRCPHRNRQVYPWSETCLDCGKRLRG